MPAHAWGGDTTEFGVPTTGSFPHGIAAGPDGNLWFAEEGENKIGRITPSGVITEFPIPTANSCPVGIVTGPDGNLWFTEWCVSKIGRITPSGVITEFAIPTANSFPHGITAGPDGNLWFVEDDTNKIGRITPSGVITEFAIPTANSYLFDIVAGPDGNLWFTEHQGNKIGRITPSGVITEFPLSAAFSMPRGIAAGPDGNLWFTEHGAGKIGRITPSGVITEFAIPTANRAPDDITAGVDGNLWFTYDNDTRLGQVTPSGVVTELPLPTHDDYFGIAAGPDCNLWFTAYGGNTIDRFELQASVSTGTAASSQPTCNATVPTGVTYTVTGSRHDIEVMDDGTIAGTGSINDLLVHDGGQVTPGDAGVGCFQVGDTTLEPGSSLEIEIGGPAACGQYDRLVATGTVELTDATLDVSLVNGFAPNTGQTFVIIDNDDTDAITGTFAGLPEGTDLNANGETYRLSYIGGDGNDVTLTVVSGSAAPGSGSSTSSPQGATPSSIPSAPNTGLGSLIEPGRSLGLVLIASGAVLAVAGLAISRRRYMRTLAKIVDTGR